MKHSILILGLLIAAMNIGLAQDENTVLKTDFNGDVVSGSVEALIAKLQEGKALRIGWQLDFDKDGVSDLEHWIDANFISIMNGHVFNQIEPIYRQVPKREIPQVEILQSEMQWTAIIGTNGKLISRYIIPELALIEDDMVRARLESTAKIKERVVATTWVVRE